MSILPHFFKTVSTHSFQLFSSETSKFFVIIFSFEEIFSRQIEAFGNAGDILILLSTSGNSKNQIIAAKKCQELGVKVVSFTGKDGGELKKLSDFNLNVGHAGTTMRFLTAYLATLENKKFHLSGSKRMNERPIGILVKALNDLGFNINYIGNEGFPPIEIIGCKNLKNKVKLKPNVSSQYISCLLYTSDAADE